MKSKNTILGLCLPLLLAMQPATQPAAKPADHPAIKAYRGYVQAIRKGDEKAVIALVQEVPAESKPALAAAVGSLIAVEAVKNEMVARMGPPKLEEEGWNMGQLPDEMLNALRVGSEQPEGAVIVIKDPQDPNGSEGTAGLMIRNGDEWRVPASMVFGLSPTPTFEIAALSKEESEQIMTMSTSITAGAWRVLARLKAGEFKDPVAVQTAIGDEVQKGP